MGQLRVGRVAGHHQRVDGEGAALLRDDVVEVAVLLHGLGELAVPAQRQPHVARQQHVLVVGGVVGLDQRLLEQQQVAGQRQQARVGLVGAVALPLEGRGHGLAHVVHHQDAAREARVPQGPERVDRARLAAVVADATGAPQVGHGEAVAGVVLAVQQARVEVRQVRQGRAVEGQQAALAHELLDRVVRGAQHVVARVAGLQLGQHGLVGVVGVEVDVHAVPALELLHRPGVDVVRPDVEVQHALARGPPAGQEGRQQQAQPQGHGQGRAAPALQPPGPEQQHAGRHQQQGRHRVDLGRQARAHHRVDLERQRGRAHAGHEAGDDVVVDREREDQQGGGQHARRDARQRDLEEGGPGTGAQVHGGLLQAAVEALQPGPHHDHGVGEREGHVGQDHGQEAQPQPQRGEQQQQRRGHHDLGHHHRQRQQPLEGRPAPEAVAVEGQRGGRPHHGADGRRGGGHQQAVAQGRHQARVAQQPAVPVEGEALPLGGQPPLVEREHHQHDQRRVQEHVDQQGPQGQEGGARLAAAGAHGRESTRAPGGPDGPPAIDSRRLGRTCER